MFFTEWKTKAVHSRVEKRTQKRKGKYCRRFQYTDQWAGRESVGENTRGGADAEWAESGEGVPTEEGADAEGARWCKSKMEDGNVFIKRKDLSTTVLWIQYCKLASICMQNNFVKIFNMVNISRTWIYLSSLVFFVYLVIWWYGCKKKKLPQISLSLVNCKIS